VQEDTLSCGKRERLRNAAAGVALFDAIMAVEMVLAIAIVPAAAAGGVCQDKMNGGLHAAGAR
jgi:hypothetical protein